MLNLCKIRMPAIVVTVFVCNFLLLLRRFIMMHVCVLPVNLQDTHQYNSHHCSRQRTCQKNQYCHVTSSFFLSFSLMIHFIQKKRSLYNIPLFFTFWIQNTVFLTNSGAPCRARRIFTLHSLQTVFLHIRCIHIFCIRIFHIHMFRIHIFHIHIHWMTQDNH